MTLMMGALFVGFGANLEIDPSGPFGQHTSKTHN